MAQLEIKDDKIIITFANGATVQANAVGDYVELDILVNDTVGGYLYADPTGLYLGTNSGSKGMFFQAGPDDKINIQFNGETRIVIDKDGITAPSFNQS